MTMPTTAAERPAPKPPSIGWVVRRAALGISIMLVVTGLAAYIAHASIDLSVDGTDQAVPSISIGEPAAALLKPTRRAQ